MHCEAKDHTQTQIYLSPEKLFMTKQSQLATKDAIFLGKKGAMRLPSLIAIINVV